MMQDPQRRAQEQNSPKTSPRGSRSPGYPRQDSTGTLKTTISLGKNPVIVHTGPFYLLKELPGWMKILKCSPSEGESKTDAKFSTNAA